jgi:Chaperone of endosialidase
MSRVFVTEMNQTALTIYFWLHRGQFAENTAILASPLLRRVTTPAAQSTRQSRQSFASSAHMKTTTLPRKDCVKCTPYRFALLFISIALACFAPAPQMRAVCQDACLTNNNTVQGDDALVSNTSGVNNTATGSEALLSNTTGTNNTAIGFQALYSNLGDPPFQGSYNVAIGSQALFSNTTGIYNTASGASALFGNTIGSFNTASGVSALASNTTGNDNTATGFNALYFNTTGNENTAHGDGALLSNTTGSFNTASGESALVFNTTGRNNTADGVAALFKNISGLNNTAMGFYALQNNTTGSANIALGSGSGANLTTGSDNIEIGNAGIADESRTIHIGTRQTHRTTFIAGISGATVSAGVPVIVDITGHLGTTTSSARYKEAIKPMDKASEALLALKPVTFRYKHELDPDGIPQFGLVAEDVEKANPDLVARDEQGKAYTVRYDAVNAMLLNEFLKEHRKVEQQQVTIAELKAELRATATRQQKQIDALTAGLQRVSAQVEASKLGSQIVSNGP